MEAIESIPAPKPSQDDLYREAADTFGPAIERLARAYEADPDRRAVQAAQAAGWRPDTDGMALVLSLWASVHGWAALLIDGLLPPGIAVKDDDWFKLAQALL